MSKEIMSYEEAAGYLGNRQFRASAEDRSRTVTTLRKAFNAQRLTEEEYNTRAERALGAVEQDELRRIVQDLPEAHAAHEPPATRWITSASKLRSAHCFAVLRGESACAGHLPALPEWRGRPPHS